MPISRADRLYYIFALISLLFAFYTIAIHIGFIFLPVISILTGIAVSSLRHGKGLKVFFFLVPLINSLPAFFFNGYPFNLMATVLFFLSGLIIGSWIKGGLPSFSDFIWSGPYLFFLGLIWISVVFVLLRWSNITIPSGALFADTPVGPGTPQCPRVSFAIIFPSVTLFLFSIPPFTAALINKYSLKKEEIYKFLIGGYSFSVVLALYQKLFDSGFMAISWWGDRKNQYNGGFSDFNGFGFFGGCIFLYSALKLMDLYSTGSEMRRSKEKIFFIMSVIVSFSGVILSGSRTAFIFVIFFFLFLLSSKLKNIVKIAVPVVLICILLLSGGVLLKRLEKTFDSSRFRSKNILDVIDGYSNGRVQMIANSIPMIAEYPVSGVGAGNFLFHLKYIKYGEKSFEDLPLNQYLLFLDEIGIIGLLSFLFFIFILIRGKKRDIYLNSFYVILLVMLVGNSLWLPEIAVLFWMFVV